MRGSKSRRFETALNRTMHCHCEPPQAAKQSGCVARSGGSAGLLRRCAPRNDGLIWALALAAALVAAPAAADELKLLRVTPSGDDVPAQSQIVLAFDRAVVPLPFDFIYVSGHDRGLSLVVTSASMMPENSALPNKSVIAMASGR